MENQKTMGVNELVFGLMFGASNLPTLIEYKGVRYYRDGDMVTYKQEGGDDLLKVDTSDFCLGGTIKILEEAKTRSNDEIINKLVDKIEYLKDEVQEVQNAIDDIDIHYQVEEANDRAYSLGNEIDELDDIIQELRGA